MTDISQLPPSRFKVGDRVSMAHPNGRGDRLFGRLKERSASPASAWFVQLEAGDAFGIPDGHVSGFYARELRHEPEVAPPAPPKFKIGDRVYMPIGPAISVSFFGRVSAPWVEANPLRGPGWLVVPEGRDNPGAYYESEMLPTLVDGEPPRPSEDREIVATPFKPGDRVRVTRAGRSWAYAEDSEIMVVAKICDDGIVEMTHNLAGGMPSPWAADLLELVVDNAVCPRCGSGAYQGLFSVTCQRAGGCKTLDELIGEPMIGNDDRLVDVWTAPIHPDLRSERGWYAGKTIPGETRAPMGPFATLGLAVAAWKEMRREALDPCDRASCFTIGYSGTFAAPAPTPKAGVFMAAVSGVQ